MSQWDPSTFGGREDAGSGKCRLSNIQDQLLMTTRDVAAGVAILLEAGGLMTTANPPPDEATCPIPDVKLGSRLYLAIR
jgi:hypothetical protein